MEIKIKEGVTWQTDPHTSQTESAMRWIYEEIYPLLAMNTEETGKVMPQTDRFGRPIRWVIENKAWRVTIRREYINPQQPTWGRRGDVINVETVKGGEE
ncbi:hypothetical protein AB9N12_17670 [Bacteroides sp. AN502(2024)]|uniref:hypothetical protein n=1 Tax=Bacteroides sp. AN502(2024) TaxID=3160599 RepID=UPI003518A3AA